MGPAEVRSEHGWQLQPFLVLVARLHELPEAVRVHFLRYEGQIARFELKSRGVLIHNTG